MFTLEDLLGVLRLEEIAADRYRAANLPMPHGVVLGGQLLGQAVVAAVAGHEGKTVKTLHMVFARSASPDAPLDIAVDPLHSGRALASTTVTIAQGETVCARALALLSADEADLIRHADESPDVKSAEDSPSPGSFSSAWDIRVVDGVDISDPDAVGPPELGVWVRFPGAPEDEAVNQALLAFATDGFLIGTAMRPHAGVGQSQAHVTLSTGVLSHTLTYHEPVSAAGWLLLDQRSPYAGRGRSYGQANVFDAGGRLVAAFVQDAMIRAKSADGSSRL